jgi:L-amino acid N-acyltransferase
MENTTVNGIRIRPAHMDDLEGITEIYNEAILTTTATFDTEQKTVEEQVEWFENHGDRYPILVATDGKYLIFGWASLSQWSDRCAYSDTAEISLYVKEEFRGQGIGGELMNAILLAGKEAGLHSILARVAEGNPVSVKIHESAGFEMVGTMKEVGRKFGRLLDVHLMQLVQGGTS